MKRRWIGAAALTAMAASIGFVAWFPGYRLDSELAAARVDGIPTGYAELKAMEGRVPDGQNAALAIWNAADEDRDDVLLRGPVDTQVRMFGFGAASRAEVVYLRRVFANEPTMLGGWRSASRRPKIDLRRAWDAPPEEFAELQDIERGVRRLVVAAQLGVEPRENLFAAAHLSALLRQVPAVATQEMGMRLGRMALAAARPADLLRKTEVELGPPADLKLLLRSKLARLIEAMRSIGPDGGNGALDLMKQSKIYENNAVAGMIAQWRQTLREMPDDPEDFEGAEVVLARRMPGIRRSIESFSPSLLRMGHGAVGIEGLARDCDRYARERATLTLRP